MKRLTACLLAVLVLALSACADKGEPNPAPASTPTPTATGTPSQAELSATAEETYRAAFDEWKRLERQGGASEASLKLSDYADGAYLDSIVAALRHQKDQRVQIEGPMPTTRVVPQPGQGRDGADPRMTLQVCEDNTGSTALLNGDEIPGRFVAGIVYLGERSGRLKVVSSSTKEVSACGS